MILVNKVCKKFVLHTSKSSNVNVKFASLIIVVAIYPGLEDAGISQNDIDGPQCGVSALFRGVVTSRGEGQTMPGQHIIASPPRFKKRSTYHAPNYVL